MRNSNEQESIRPKLPRYAGHVAYTWVFPSAEGFSGGVLRIRYPRKTATLVLEFPKHLSTIATYAKIS